MRGRLSLAQLAFLDHALVTIERALHPILLIVVLGRQKLHDLVAAGSAFDMAGTRRKTYCLADGKPVILHYTLLYRPHGGDRRGRKSPSALVSLEGSSHGLSVGSREF